MSVTHNRRIINEMKDELIDLYVKLGQCTRKRDAANIRINERKISEMEKLLTQRFVRVYDCQCESDEDSDEAYEHYLMGRRFKCISCLRGFVGREKAKYPPLLDKLNWGLEGAADPPLSDDSSGVTSSDDSDQKAGSYAKHKFLRKLRRKGPDKFESKYFSTGVEEFLKMEIGEDELKDMLVTESALDLMAKREKSKKKFVRADENFDDYACEFYDFSGDTRLKNTYSDSKFKFISQIIGELHRYLEQHSKDFYPNVSEVISCSESEFCEDRETLRHYYEVLKKKAAVKNVSKSNPAEMVKSTDSCPSDPDDLTAKQIDEAGNTGELDLSGKSLHVVPALVWLMDKAPVCYKGNDTENCDHEYRPLTKLDLGGNLLTSIMPDGSSLNTLVTLRLANNRISKLPPEFKNFTCLGYLDIAGNKLRKLPKAFGLITTLKRLDVSNNVLESVPNELRKLDRLTTLELRWNKLKCLPDSISELCSLKLLDVGYNRLRNLPVDTKNMTGLVVLDVSYNKISELPNLAGMKRLFVLNASGNYVKQFPCLSDCKRLCEIRLDGNRIKTLSVDSVKNVPVVQLTLSYNKISRVPEDYCRLESLVLLDLTGNRVDWLPWSLARLKYLSCLKVELNPIRNLRGQDIKEGSKRILEVLLRNLLNYRGDKEAVIRAKNEMKAFLADTDSEQVSSESAPPKEEVDGSSIEASYKNINLLGKTAIPVRWLQEFADNRVSSLDLSRNSLGWLPYPVTVLSDSLEQLFVRHNCFQSIPEFIHELKHLTVLDVSGNHLTSLPPAIAKCPLRQLVCQFNRFTQIPNVLYEISTLEVLDVSYNDIKSLNVEGLKKMTDLNTLNLRCNEIKVVPSALGFLTNICELDLHENSFKYPEKTVLDKGTEEVMAYLRKHDDNHVLYEYQEEPKESKNTKKRVTIAKYQVACPEPNIDISSPKK